MKKLLLITVLVLAACTSNKKEKLTAQQIIDKSIIASGTDKVASATISFKFRDKSYKATRNAGNYKLERSFDSIKDVLSNEGFKRFVDGKQVVVSDSMIPRYSNSVNSVHYFSVLPYGLNDKAVNKKLLKSVKIKEKEYYKIQVTFNKDGGGDDFDDVFIYWIGKKDFLVDYLAYSYHTNDGGMRFRAPNSTSVINGIRFLNYDNFKPKSKDVNFEELDILYEKDELVKLSEINLENIQVELNQ